MDGDAYQVQISDCDLPQFVDLAAHFGTSSFGYAVTPNADHLLRYAGDAAFREIYRTATFVLFDSRFLARLIRLTKGQRLPTCTGSDLTDALFTQVVSPEDGVVLIGGSAAQAEYLRRNHSLRSLKHYEPAMGFIKDAAAVERCLEFIEGASPFRYCFLAVGCPQQEILAQQLLKRGRARGLALCVGGAVNFLTGAERRAPAWMQNCGLEWLHRLWLDPRRLWQRYLVRGPRIFWLLPKLQFTLRPAPAGKTPSLSAAVPSTSAAELASVGVVR